MILSHSTVAQLPWLALTNVAVPLPMALVGLLIKVTLLLAAAGLAATLLRRHAAATRHLVWLVALAASLALVVLTPIVPRLTFSLPRPEPTRSAAAFASVPPAAAAAVTPSRGWSVLGEVPMRAAAEVAGFHNLPALPARHKTADTREPWRLVARVLAALWLAGFLMVLVWFALGRLALALLSREAHAVAPEVWQPLLAHSRDAADTARTVRVATSARVGAPLMWGWPRPVLMLPVAALTWPELRLRDALLHELAHVARGDYLAQSLASLACAVFWFHPLVWHAAARLRSECEHACDDRVLAAGTAAPEYASTLLEVARAARTLRAAGGVAVGMARRSHLEGRLLAVLDDSRPRAVLSRPTRALAWGVTALALVPLAGLAPRSGSATAATSAETTLAGEAVPEVKVESFGTSRKTSVTTTMDTAQATSSTTRTAQTEPGSTFDYRAAAKPGGTLELELKTGGSVELRAWNEPAVSVHARLSGRDWKDTHITADPTGSGVALRTWQEPENDHSYSTSHVFEIQVPASYDVRLKSAGGGLSIVGVAGTFRGVTGGGDIQLTHARGRAYLTTGGGTVQVSDCDLSGSVATGGGAVRITRSRGGLVATSGSGATLTADGSDHGDAADISDDGDSDTVNLGVAEPDGFKYAPKTGAAGFVRIAKAGGDVDVDAAPHGAYVMTGGGDVHVGPSAGSVAVTTGGGGITLGPVAGSVWAGTGSGPVTVRLADPEGAKQTVDITSGTGKVILELPSGLDARFDLETAYTNAFGRSTAITGPWKLDVTRTQDWDGTQGTPRRYVRASGVAGSGRGLIRVRTVNGDIEVRKLP